MVVFGEKKVFYCWKNHHQKIRLLSRNQLQQLWKKCPLLRVVHKSFFWSLDCIRVQTTLDDLFQVAHLINNRFEKLYNSPAIITSSFLQNRLLPSKTLSFLPSNFLSLYQTSTPQLIYIQRPTQSHTSIRQYCCSISTKIFLTLSSLSLFHTLERIPSV